MEENGTVRITLTKGRSVLSVRDIRTTRKTHESGLVTLTFLEPFSVENGQALEIGYFTTIDEAVVKLEEKLGDKEVFNVRHDGEKIIVDVNFIYRVKDVTDLGGRWKGFLVVTGRRSCW